MLEYMAHIDAFFLINDDLPMSYTHLYRLTLFKNKREKDKSQFLY